MNHIRWVSGFVSCVAVTFELKTRGLMIAVVPGLGIRFAGAGVLVRSLRGCRS